MLGWTETASNAEDTRTVKAALDIVRSRAAHARDIARRAIGAAVTVPGPSVAEAVARDAAVGLAVEAKRADVAIDVDVAPDACGALVSSGTALLQVLTNLLLNAVAFSPPGARVRLALSGAAPGFAQDAAGGPPSCVIFHVDDAGPGISPEVRARLFEGGVSSRRGGAGIGLRHSAALAASSGGELRLGDAVRGTRFELIWPALGPESVAVAPSLGASGASGEAGAATVHGPHSEARPSRSRPVMEGARILIVEDDDAVIELLELALEARGATVVSVKARADLPRVLASGRFDAALLDMSPLLDDIDGAISELRRASPHARLVVMSGSVPPERISADAVWVRKPFEVREIVDVLAIDPSRSPAR